MIVWRRRAGAGIDQIVQVAHAVLLVPDVALENEVRLVPVASSDHLAQLVDAPCVAAGWGMVLENPQRHHPLAGSPEKPLVVTADDSRGAHNLAEVVDRVALALTRGAERHPASFGRPQDRLDTPIRAARSGDPVGVVDVVSGTVEYSAGQIAQADHPVLRGPQERL